jgi:phosphoribosylformylglycinamidine cyclo-ligase
VIETKRWQVPGLFQLLKTNGNVPVTEMYQVFNMGIGMAAVVAERSARQAIASLRAKRIGYIKRGTGKVRLKL